VTETEAVAFAASEEGTFWETNDAPSPEALVLMRSGRSALSAPEKENRSAERKRSGRQAK
ncbi:MAG: hypothetical protein IJH79_11215, partial [Lentisphaeria bacterium]|nr:hypothetical protein [Lentisphaeria bacterium]